MIEKDNNLPCFLIFALDMTKISVIIADSSDIVRMGLTKILEQTDFIYRISGVSNEEELLETINAEKTDIVLLDYTSKGFSIGSIVKTKLANRKIKLIGLTHLPNKETVNMALKNGIISHIKKDCPAQEILDAVIETSENNHFFCGEILDILKDQEEGSLNCAPVSLSDREMDVVKLISEGYTNAQIAVVLHISNHTVNTHRKNIMKKLGVGNTAGIVMFAVKTNLVSPDKFHFSPQEN